MLEAPNTAEAVDRLVGRPITFGAVKYAGAKANLRESVRRKTVHDSACPPATILSGVTTDKRTKKRKRTTTDGTNNSASASGLSAKQLSRKNEGDRAKHAPVYLGKLFRVVSKNVPEGGPKLNIAPKQEIEDPATFYRGEQEEGEDEDLMGEGLASDWRATEVDRLTTLLDDHLVFSSSHEWHQNPAAPAVEILQMYSALGERYESLYRTLQRLRKRVVGFSFPLFEAIGVRQESEIPRRFIALMDRRIRNGNAIEDGLETSPASTERARQATGVSTGSRRKSNQGLAGSSTPI